MSRIAEISHVESDNSIVDRRWRTAGVGIRRTLGLAASVVLLTFIAGAHAANNASYTYDTLGRLVKAAYSDGVKTTTITYYYDGVGNRTSVVSTAAP